MELGDQPDAGEDHHRAHDDGAEHAEHQYALLQLERNGEEAEQHQPDEDVVDGQRFLDQVAGDVFERFLVGHLAPGAPSRYHHKRAGEEQRDADPDPRPGGRLLEADAMLLAAADHEEVDRQHDQHDGEEAGPHPPGADCFHCKSFLRVKKTFIRR